MSGEGQYEGTRSEMDRAIKRLGVLEHIFLMVAALTSLIAGALVAWLLKQAVDLPFRPTWAVSSLALFLIPGVLSWMRVRREDRAHEARRTASESETES